jgi:hypothetical protein
LKKGIFGHQAQGKACESYDSELINAEYSAHFTWNQIFLPHHVFVGQAGLQYRGNNIPKLAKTIHANTIIIPAV